jgi:hypothetical protein
MVYIPSLSWISRDTELDILTRISEFILVIVPSRIPYDGELLIDFRELLGEHSGENMAEAVWETLVMYGIEGRVVITCDSSKLICLPM